MERRPVLVVAVALALALAGCNALGPAAGPATPSETVTPVPVDAGAETATADRRAVNASTLPPGVTADGAVTPSALLAAHRETLEGEPFTASVDYERRSSSDDIGGGFTERMAADGDGRFLAERVRSANRTRAVYVDGTAGYTRSVVGNSSDARALTAPTSPEYFLATDGAVRTFLPADDATVRQVEREGQTYTRVHVTDVPWTLAGRHPKQTVTDYTATAYLTPNGSLRTLAVDYGFTTGDERVAASLRIDYRRGPTTVDRPEWVPEAWNAGSNGTATDDGERETAGTDAASEEPTAAPATDDGERDTPTAEVR